jgi:dihydroxyacetone kinase
MGGSLDDVIAAAQKAIANTRSIGIGLSACVIPAVGKANFEIKHGTMEVGIGHHGEPGIDVRPTASAADMAEMMLSTVLPDLPFARGDRVAVLVSGLGATPLMEQYILYGELASRLQTHGIRIGFQQVGNLFTSLEMMGVTLTLMKLDDELEACLKHPCHSVGLTVAGELSAARSYAGQQAVTAQVAPVARQAAVQASRAIVGPAIALAQAGDLVRDLIAVIVENRQYLSEIDGLIGDGDHGINMAKGFNGCGQRLDALGQQAHHLPTALAQLSQALMDDIGGSMGPLYGEFFQGLSRTLQDHAQIDADLFGEALATAVAKVHSLGQAAVGDKTLMDTLAPALQAFRQAHAAGLTFGDCLQAMSDAAAAGRDSTKDLQARIGRSARLGPRSIGVLDAGATSCCLILQSMAASLQRQLGVPARP